MREETEQKATIERVILGKTGLEVSRMGLGCGGHSRLGQRYGVPTETSVRIVRKALECGINFIDTAESYRTEPIVGAAIKVFPRDEVVLSTKISVRDRSWGGRGLARKPNAVKKAIKQRLENLGTSYLDILHFHAVHLEQYEHVVNEQLPAVLEARDQGLVRFVGITEEFNSDMEHRMLQHALEDDCWDVIMVGFNMLNQQARDTVIRRAMERNVGVLVMFAVRAVLSNLELLAACVEYLVDEGEVDPSDLDDMKNPLDFLVHPDDGGASSIVDAAYRFCMAEPGVHVVLSGTGNPAHLDANIESFTKPPLPPGDVARLKHVFRNVRSVTGE